jgi:signal transduction histidine kinase
MPFGLMSSVRWQVTIWVFGALLVSWIVSSALSTLFLYHEITTLRQEMLAQPARYPNPIPQPQLTAWDLILGPQSLISRRRQDGPPPVVRQHPTADAPHADAPLRAENGARRLGPPPDAEWGGPPPHAREAQGAVPDDAEGWRPPRRRAAMEGGPQRPPREAAAFGGAGDDAWGDAPPPRPAREGAEAGPPPRARVGQVISGWRGVALRAAVALGLALLIGVTLGRRFTRPLQALAHGAREYRQGHFTHRIAIESEHEFAEVAASMNAMATQVAGHIDRVEGDNRRRQQLLADVAHELRSPVMTMRTMAGALADGTAEDPERRRRAVTSLVRTADRLAHLVRDLLELAKLDLHELPLHRQLIDLREVVQACGATHQEAVERAGQQLHIQVPAESVRASLDPNRLAQVLDNLLTNAQSYAGDGATITLALTGGPPIRLVVADTGRGIPAKHLPFIFEPFYRADAARTPQDDHSGLGLRIVKGLVEAHGGTLVLESVEGRGTTATVTLGA